MSNLISCLSFLDELAVAGIEILILESFFFCCSPRLALGTLCVYLSPAQPS